METARKDTRDPGRTRLLNLAKRLKIDPESGPLARLYPEAETEEEDLSKAYRTFVDILAERFRQREPVVLVISGPEAGVGKSTLAIQLCQDVHQELGLPEFPLRNIVESSAELEREYQSPGTGMYIYDEGSRGLLSRKGSRDKEQAGLIDTIVTQRKNNKGLIICVVKKKMLDAIVSWGIANFTVFLPERGIAKVSRVWRSDEHRRSQSRLPYDVYEDVPKFKFRNLDRTRFFRDYLEQARARNVAAWRKAAIDPEGLLRDCPFCGYRGTKLEVARHECAGFLEQNKKTENQPITDTQRHPHVDETGGGGVAAPIASPAPAPAPPPEPPPPETCPKCGRGGLINWYNYRGHVGACKGPRKETLGAASS